MLKKSEYILCSAIWYDDGKINIARRSYTSPKTGFVLCGWRHPDIIANLPTNNKFRNDEKEYKCTQGFITNKGRFVDREEAYLIAKKANQLLHDFKGKTILFSEDIY